MKKIYPLSGRGKPIFYENRDYNLIINWGNLRFKVSISIINNILNNYFIDYKTWYPLGAHMTNPIKNSLGEFIQKNYASLTPRHATVLAAIMANENFIEYKSIKPILLRKMKKLI